MLMGYYWKTDNNRLRLLNRTPLLFYFFSIFFFSSCLLFGTINSKVPCLDMRCSLTRKPEFHFQGSEKVLEKMKAEEMVSFGLASARRFLSGPGSWPPLCAFKCGGCTPCKPVHVPVPPGTPVTTEYYPEAWRCKCGNRLYMP